MICKENRNIMILAIQSRLLIFFLQILFNYLMPDHKADAFNPPISNEEKFLDRCVSFLFSGLSQRWDSIHFLHISFYGYTFENQLAFFPLYPLLVKVVGKFLNFTFFFLLPSEISIFMIISVLLNFLFFVFSSVFHYQLGIHVLRDRKKAFHATQLFCVNPASIFFSASYSESLFSMLSHCALLMLEKDRLILASFLVALCSLTRSNGLLLIGFLIFKTIVHLYSRFSVTYFALFKSVLILILKLIIGVTISVLPFLAYQFYSYNLLCLSKSDTLSIYPKELVKYANDHEYKFIGIRSFKLPLCTTVGMILPYSAIQSEFWNVGFMKYYEWKQVPNFILASPIFLICLYLTVDYIYNSLKIINRLEMKTDLTQESVDNSSTQKLLFLNLLPYVLHMLFVVLFSIVYVHIQVSTRLLCSSCPVIYWLISEYCSNSAKLSILNRDNDQNIIHTSNNHADIYNNVNNIDDQIYCEIIGEPYVDHHSNDLSQNNDCTNKDLELDNNSHHKMDSDRCNLRQRKTANKNFVDDKNSDIQVKHELLINYKNTNTDHYDYKINDLEILKDVISQNILKSKFSDDSIQDQNICDIDPNCNVNHTNKLMEDKNTELNNLDLNNKEFIRDKNKDTAFKNNETANLSSNINHRDLNDVNNDTIESLNGLKNDDLSFKEGNLVNSKENVDFLKELNKIFSDSIVRNSISNDDVNFLSLIKDIEDDTEEYIDEIDIWNSCYLGKIVNIYFHMYFFVGTAAFSNFLPWT